METSSRSSGLSGVGRQPWGTHFCLFYENREDLIDLLIPYLKAGLEDQEFCLCVVSEPVIAKEAERALRKAVRELHHHVAQQQIEIVTYQHWYLQDGDFDPLRVRQRWIDKLEQAIARGYVGMRVAANVEWLERKNWERFAKYEAELDEAFGKLPILGMCAYPLARCTSADLLDVVAHHQFSLARRRGVWERLEGEQLQLAHAEALRLNADLERRVEERTAQLVATNALLKTEIDGRRQTEDSLRHSEEQFRLAIDAIPVMAWSVRADGAVDFLNRTWIDYCGLSLEQHLADTTGTIHPEDIARVIDLWRAKMATGEPYEQEMRLRRADGEYRWFLVRTAPARNESGQIVKWYGVSTDIDDRKRAEEALRESQQLLQQVVATLPVGVAVVDQAGDIILSNAAADRIWGGMIVHGRDRWSQSKGYWHDSGKRIEAADWASVRALRNGQTSLNELIDIESFDGKQKTMQNSAAPIRDTQGTIVGAVIINEDATERVRADQALAESAERLHFLSRRLLEVQEEERRHISRELHDEFGQLLATITLHLHAAKGAVGEAGQSCLAECMDLLRQAGEQVRRLALQLRPTMLETAGLDGALRWLADQHQRQTGITAHVEGHSDGVAGGLAVASFRVTQEALTNVVRHARARTVWIELSQSETRLELLIRDDGVGFDVERTLGQAASRGSLGLLGMRERVEVFHGRLDVDSAPGCGTCVRASFPLPGAATEPAGGEA